MKQDDVHFHKTSKGTLVRCYHKCRSMFTDASFWIGMTFGFPFEHYLWTKVWPFTTLSAFLGLD